MEYNLLDFTVAYIVSSIEQRSCWSWTRKPIFILPMFKDYSTPSVFTNKRSFSIPDNKTVVMYHGNRVHLENFLSRYKRVLRLLTSSHHFILVYNYSHLGKVNPRYYGLSDSLFTHIQFSHENMLYASHYADFGIVPHFHPPPIFLLIFVV